MMTAMKMRHEIRYDAPSADVHARLSDPAFDKEHEAGVERLGGGR
jgi:hypothetical protein